MVIVELLNSLGYDPLPLMAEDPMVLVAYTMLGQVCAMVLSIVYESDKSIVDESMVDQSKSADKLFGNFIY